MPAFMWLSVIFRRKYQLSTVFSAVDNFFVWQKNKPPARQVEGVALASSKKPPVII